MHFSANTDSSMRICCNTANGGFIKKNNSDKNWYLEDITDPLEYFNSDQYNQIRLDMINGVRPKICERCFHFEDQGGSSVRQTMIKVYPYEEIVQNTDFETGKLKETNVISIDFSWGNKCNLKCKMCGPSSSDQLIDEWKNMGLIKNISWHENINLKWNYSTHKDLLESFAPNIKDILVTGGEPLVNNEYYQFLEFLVEKGYSKNITLKFHSNLAVLPKKFMEIWPKFGKVRPNISIDGVDNTYEYIRYPSKWSVVSKNIDDLVNLAKQMDLIIDVHTVFTNFNAHGVPDLIKYFSKYANDTKYISPFPYFIWVQSPSHANVQALPSKVKDEIERICSDAIKRYEEYFMDPWSIEKIDLLRANLRLMKEQQIDTSKFYEFTELQDKFRPLKGPDVIPWYSEYK
jgi:sulfatase maturation enzyme AslB (radical SAM superfamily)